MHLKPFITNGKAEMKNKYKRSKMYCKVWRTDYRNDFRTRSGI